MSTHDIPFQFNEIKASVDSTIFIQCQSWESRGILPNQYSLDYRQTFLNFASLLQQLVL